MPTIASVAERLDMSAEEAVLVLRKLHFDVESVDSEISDEQCDMLIDVDEQPETLDRYLQEVLKKEDQKKKKAERLQKAAQKVAAKRKAQAKAKPKAAAKRATRRKTEEGEEKEEEEAAPEPVAAAAEIETPVLETVEPLAEIIIEEEVPAEEPPQPEVPAVVIGSAIEHAAARVEVVRADGTSVEAPDVEVIEGPLPHEEEAVADAHAPGLLAEAERRQEMEERRKAKLKPLPKPDPEVVAEVIRRAREKDRKKEVAAVTVEVPELGFEEAGRGQRAKRGKSSKTTAPGKTARKKQKRIDRARLEEEMRRDAAAVVRDFQAGGLDGPRKRKKKRSREESVVVEEVPVPAVIEVQESMTVEQLANAAALPVNEVILELMDENILVNKNYNLDLDLIRKIAENHGFEVRTVIPEEEAVMSDESDNPEDLEPRPPVITVMGHVDHGKTTLLDVVRRSSVAASEAGGITQHIAAYDVQTNAGRLIFLDTPGHEAFTQMRARGAKVTDIVVLVVAADDGVRPQTIEAINHAKAAEVPIVVAINKCDKPDAQPGRVRQELTQYDLIDESWGGKTIIKEISAKTGRGVDDLMELLVLQSETLDLKANPKKRARGTIVESEVSVGQGALAWVLVQNGTLRVQDAFLAGETFGRVRTLTTSGGKHVREVGPATPVLVTGFGEPPNAGDIFVAVEDERVAKSIAEQRAALRKQRQGPAMKRVTLEDFHAMVAAGKEKVLNVILKADVQGSVDVLQSSFARLGNQEVRVNIVHAAVGGINESDVLLASASEAVVIGFHVTANARIQKVAESEGVEIRTYRIIYEAIEEVQKALEGMLAPERRQVITGHAEIRQVFRSSALGNIAGCYQVDGETSRASHVRLLRDDVVVFEGRIESLRRGKDDVKSVSAGFECGIKLEGYDDIKEGDTIEAYRVEEVAKTLN
ncbi:MAG: translation initiation factor IF-2 [Candidatus Hydrogenedentes bacterium]|nr:translation initiation factor IF-2 [Candidatus Hydrogenedentota bacterium]